jgi:hypothetical protein
MMKIPDRVFVGNQDLLNAGLNAFALELLAESFADDPARFGDSNILLRATAHNGQDVWFVLTKTQPRPEDFASDVSSERERGTIEPVNTIEKSANVSK